jgi:hypothetical protein
MVWPGGVQVVFRGAQGVCKGCATGVQKVPSFVLGCLCACLEGFGVGFEGFGGALGGFWLEVVGFSINFEI